MADEAKANEKEKGAGTAEKPGTAVEENAQVAAKAAKGKKPAPKAAKADNAPNPSKPLREMPSAVELTDEQYGRIVKRAGGAVAEKSKRRKWNPDLVKRHDELLQLLRNGVTTRVIHTKFAMPRSAIVAYIDGHDDLKEAYRDAQEDMLDLSEEIVNEIATLDCEMQHTENGNFPRYDGRTLATKFNAAKLRLERLGAKRGWGQKIETNEVGNGGGRAPVIFMGSFTEEMIAEADAEVRRANEEAVKGLEGIPHG